MIPHLAALALALAPEPPYMVIMESRLTGTGYEAAAERLAAFHHGEVWAWDGAWEGLREHLKANPPVYLALVMDPGSIDANLARRLVPMLAGLDDDPFVDCFYGIITGATGDDARRFVENIIRASKEDLPARRVSATSVSIDTCARVQDPYGPSNVRREIPDTELWVTGKDPAWREFLAGHRSDMTGGGIIEWGHSGDPQGIWLFSDRRNLDKSKHWPFDPAKVGQDPEGEMPRMTPAALLDGVDLFPSVVINGACHSGVTRRAVVAGDIVSTFGDTGGVVRFYDIRPEESFPLMAIAHGAVAYIGPLGPNNANRASLEEWRIAEGGTPLGAVVKECSDELVMGAAEGAEGRRLSFALFEEGKPPPRESAMYHDTAQRVLFGDPAFTPWRGRVPTSHHVETAREGETLRVTIRWDNLKKDPWVWDPWREDRRPGMGRVYERVVLERASASAGAARVVEAVGTRGGVETPLHVTAFCLLERDPEGKAVVHIKAEGSRAEMDARAGQPGPDSLRVVVEIPLRE